MLAAVLFHRLSGHVTPVSVPYVFDHNMRFLQFVLCLGHQISMVDSSLYRIHVPKWSPFTDHYVRIRLQYPMESEN
jgi:hypothetical protein